MQAALIVNWFSFIQASSYLSMGTSGTFKPVGRMPARTIETVTHCRTAARRSRRMRRNCDTRNGIAAKHVALQRSNVRLTAVMLY
jgi:hypothetical protein